MSKLKSLPKELQAIHKRPACFFEDGEFLFTQLRAFLLGYDLGYRAVKHQLSTPEDLVPDDFHKFVTERYGFKFPAGGKGWSTFIQENTSSEREAFDLFFDLRAEYDKKSKLSKKRKI